MTRLAPQPWMTSARRVMETLEKAQPGSSRFVGGCVRNALLNQPISDVDIATQLVPQKVMMACIAAGLGAHPTGIEHGTVTVTDDHHPFEVTTLRRDVETDGRRAVVEFTEDWAEDAERRDFRMNALYCSADGEVFDPTGGGLEDIQHRRIIFVGDPETRIREDYLRILRFFRFYAWYGHGLPDAAGLAACNKLRNGLAAISAERIWMEMKKLLAAEKPIAALEAMDDAGVFDALFDEAKGLDLLRKVVGLETREHFTPDPMIRFLALFWKDASAVREVSERLKLSNEERNRLGLAVKDETPLWSALPAEEARRILYRVGPQVFRDRVILEWAQDESASDEWRTLLGAAEHYERPVMPVSGSDLLARGISEGPGVGQALRKLEAAWVESDFRLGADELLKLL